MMPEVINPRDLLMSRIPVLQDLQDLQRDSAFNVESPSAENIWQNARPRMSNAMVVVL